MVLEKTLQSPLDSKENKPVNPLEEISPEYSLEGLRAGGEGHNKGWDGWMASSTRWTWVWVNSGSWWWSGRPGVLRFMGSQRVRYNWATELNWTDGKIHGLFICSSVMLVAFLIRIGEACVLYGNEWQWRESDGNPWMLNSCSVSKPWKLKNE